MLVNSSHCWDLMYHQISVHMHNTFSWKLVNWPFLIRAAPMSCVLCSVCEKSHLSKCIGQWCAAYDGCVKMCLWLHVFHSWSWIWCLSLCLLRHFSSESNYCSSLSATSPTGVFLTLSVSPLSCVHLSRLSLLPCCFVFLPNPFFTPVHEDAVGMAPCDLC